MDIQIIMTLIASILAFIASITATIVSLYTKTTIKKELNDKKRNVYQKIASAYLKLLDFHDENLKLLNDEEAKQNGIDIRNQLKEINGLFFLYDSDDVIYKLGDIRQDLYHIESIAPKERLLIATRIIRLLRKDLNLKNDKLGLKNKEILKHFLTDYKAQFE